MVRTESLLFPTGLASVGLLDAWCVLHGCETLCRISPHRRPADGCRLPSIVRLLYGRTFTPQRRLLRRRVRVFRRYLSRTISHGAHSLCSPGRRGHHILFEAWSSSE